ncbi:MAG: DUF2917 domain-containing protein [Rhodocyclaceae bacterium]|nr:DUF2917 domain-containing protein [Rhodocyclaceae bacterium]
MNPMHGSVNTAQAARARSCDMRAYVPLVLDVDAPVWIEAGDARLWVTFEHDSTDYLIEPGCGRAAPRGRAVLTAPVDTSVIVHALRPAGATPAALPRRGAVAPA